MKIGFDAKRAVQNFTGLGNYSRYLIEILYRFYPDNEYTLYAPKARSSRQFDRMKRLCPELKCVYPSGMWKRLGAAWRSFGIMSRLTKDSPDIYHGLSGELPFRIRRAGSTKSVVTIHDLIFLRYPQYYNSIDRRIYAYKFRKACRDADAVIAISECTKRDIIRYFHTEESKIHVVYQGCDPSFAQPSPEDKKRKVREKYALPARYILSVGSIEERKNILLAVQALPDIPEEVHLVIVGRRTAYAEQVEACGAAHGLNGRIHILDKVTFDDLPAVYQQAEAFVYPSRFEGFGIPVIEALHSGVPVIAATGSCLEEAGGEDSLYVGPDDTEGMAKALRTVLDNAEKRADMIRKGKEFVKRFSERNQADELMAVYRSLADQR